MSRRLKLVSLFSVLSIVFLSAFFTSSLLEARAKNILAFKDVISDSGPGVYSNHTFSFTLKTDIAAGGYLNFSFPAGFTVPATSTFGTRNVEMYVNGVKRAASDTLSSVEDQVVLSTGSAGSIRYNLNTTTGLSANDQIEFRVGNHTSNAIVPSTYIATTTVGTTTATTTVEIVGDVGIKNAPTTGYKEVVMTTGGAVDDAYANFVIFLIEPVTIPNADTTEDIPPDRFNGAPDGTISGTTINVEWSLETNEFAVCRYSTIASTSYESMTGSFDGTGRLVHTKEIMVENETDYTFYVRCIDDEDNINTDDYVIKFSVPAQPTGTSDPNGSTEGDGEGSAAGGNAGAGSGSGSGSSGGSSGGGGGGSSGGGGGGGGSGGGSGAASGSGAAGGFTNGGDYESGDARVVINGYAYPRADIYILVDGQAGEKGTANSDGTFSVTIDAIARGVYTFGVYAIDNNDVKSTTFSTTFSVQGSRTSNISNINLSPTVRVTPDPVTPGQELTFSGYSLPNASISIENMKDKVSQSLKSYTATANSSGSWTLSVSTNGFTNGTYAVRAKATAENISTGYSEYTFYDVGTARETTSNADLNRDGKVNLTDFSILLYWWGTDGGSSNPPADINGDGSVSLTDFSIMLFNWTG